MKKKRKKKTAEKICGPFLHFSNYSSLIALAGHSEAHVPQLTQAEALISRCPLFSLIAPTGQSGSQVPQLMHVFGSIFIAIINTSQIKI